MKPKRKKAKHRITEPDNLRCENLRPIVRERFDEVVTEKQPANRRRSLANLKILELIVSGKIPQRAGEDYFLTACRIISSGLSDTRVAAATKRTFNKALAEIKRADRWTTTLADMVEMRGWGAKGAITRTILLLTLLQKMIGRVELMAWLQQPNPNLGSHAPVDLMRDNRWAVLANFVDEMLTGAPT